jgi:predicted nucleic acid-binding protein
MLLVDTNVLLDVLQDDPQWADWSIAQMRAQAKLHALLINPIVYAEISLSFAILEALDEVVDTLRLDVREIPRPALFLAAKAFAQYRRRGGTRQQVLPNFFIGAHAAVEGWPLLTRDARRYRTYFRRWRCWRPDQRRRDHMRRRCADRNQDHVTRDYLDGQGRCAPPGSSTKLPHARPGRPPGSGSTSRIFHAFEFLARTVQRETPLKRKLKNSRNWGTSDAEVIPATTRAVFHGFDSRRSTKAIWSA